jgi:hypothetical protein
MVSILPPECPERSWDKVFLKKMKAIRRKILKNYMKLRRKHGVLKR